MSVYMDASIIVPLFIRDIFSGRAEEFLRSGRPEMVVSNLAATEFSSVLARRVRTGESSEGDARRAFGAFDQWISEQVGPVECVASDFRAAESYLRRLDLTLRAPDALHIAIALRLGAELATFDQGMAESAVRLSARLAPV